MAQDCALNGKNGFVEVPLVHSFSAQQETLWPRAQELNSYFQNSQLSQTINIYYELAEPYDPNKESLMIVGGFYPWQNLGFVSSGPTAPMGFLKNAYNVFEIHFRGSGCSMVDSGRPPLIYTHEMIAADIEAVKKSLGISQLNVWASSNGAYVALTYAVLYPESAGKFLLRDTAIYNPSLAEASQNFEQKMLPEFLSDSQEQKLAMIKTSDLSTYKKVLKYLGTIFFRREDDRQAGLQIFEAISQIFVEAPADLPEVLSQLDAKIDQVMDWSEAVYANECLYGQKTEADVAVEDVFVVDYVVKRCSSYVLAHKELMMSNLDFRGRLGHLHNPFFIYQGYWDEYLYKELAMELNKQLANSRIYIDKNAGHGEISQKTYPCFAAILSSFFMEDSLEGYQQVCPSEVF